MYIFNAQLKRLFERIDRKLKSIMTALQVAEFRCS